MSNIAKALAATGHVSDEEYEWDGWPERGTGPIPTVTDLGLEEYAREPGLLFELDVCYVIRKRNQAYAVQDILDGDDPASLDVEGVLLEEMAAAYQWEVRLPDEPMHYPDILEAGDDDDKVIAEDQMTGDAWLLWTATYGALYYLLRFHWA